MGWPRMTRVTRPAAGSARFGLAVYTQRHSLSREADHSRAGQYAVAWTWPLARRTAPRRPRCRTHSGPPTKPLRTRASRADGVTLSPGARIGSPATLGSARPTARPGRGAWAWDAVNSSDSDMDCCPHHHDDGKEALPGHPRLAADRLGRGPPPQSPSNGLGPRIRLRVQTPKDLPPSAPRARAGTRVSHIPPGLSPGRPKDLNSRPDFDFTDYRHDSGTGTGTHSPPYTARTTTTRTCKYRSRTTPITGQHETNSRITVTVTNLCNQTKEAATDRK